jgi:ATP-dependent exoDNAse (exonuclease V) beta subunit
MILSRQQKAAVERVNQDVCVVAGPGSGKTRVLIERFAWLVQFHNISPTRILAITFTEKAASEIKERLIGRFTNSPEHRESIERAWVSTIDGFCSRLLQENSIAAGISPDFSVLEQASADRLAREAAEEGLDELFAERPEEMRGLMEALDLSTDGNSDRKPDLAASLLDVYQSLRISGLEELPPAEPSEDHWPEARRLAHRVLNDNGKTSSHTTILVEWACQFLALTPVPLTRNHFEAASGLTAHVNRVGKTRGADTKSLKDEVLPALQAQWIATWNAGLIDLLREGVARLDRAYRKKKRDLSALDFADLEEEAIRLLESNFEIRAATRNRFDQILMDELQDTNRLQWKLLSLIRNRGDLFAVGDINQSIYGFRRADPTVFEEYRSGLEASGAEIDDLRENYRSRQSILDAVEQVLNGQPGIEPRPLIAAKDFPPIGVSVECLVGEGDDASEVEASLIASKIRELGCDYSDVAILVRSLNALDPITRALDRFDIPFVTTGGKTFLEAREIRDLLALLAALVNPLDEIALAGVLRSPLVGLTDQETLEIGESGSQKVFAERFGHLRSFAGFLAPDRILARALDESGYLRHVSSRGRANIDKLFSWMRREHRNNPRPLAEMLDDLELLRASKSEAEAPPPEAGNVVQLMSIHSAKGLEFKVVFVSALQRGADSSTPVIAFSSNAGLGAKWRNPATGKSLPDSAYATFSKEHKIREEAEENRLLYVSMTRAEERLYLTYAKGKSMQNWQKLVEPAAFPVTLSETVIPPEKGSKTVESVPFSIIEPLHVTGQQDSSARVTSVALFELCPRKYFLETYLGVEPDLEAPGTGAMSLGAEVHKILAGGASDSPEAQELAERFRNSDLGRRSLRATSIEHEYDFLLAVEDVVLRGQIDLWFEEGGELILVDYKSDGDESPERYALQLRIYALALERYLGKLPDRAVLYYLRSGRPVEIDLSRPEDTIASIGRFFEVQKTMDFQLREGDHCRRCAFYKGVCPAGKN